MGKPERATERERKSQWHERSGSCRSKVTRVGASEWSRGDASDIDGQNREVEWAGAHESTRGSERVSIEERDFRDRRQSCEVAATECGQRWSFKIVCCNFYKGLFLKAGWRWVDRNYKEKAL